MTVENQYVGVLLCGGQSRRMKMDKAFLAVPSSISSSPFSNPKSESDSTTLKEDPNAGQLPPLPLCLHLIRAAFAPLASSMPNLIISARDETQRERIQSTLAGSTDPSKPSSHPQQLAQNIEIILDKPEYSNIGPASGLLSAHQMHPDATLIVLAVDFPRANAAALRQLIRVHEGRAQAKPPATCFMHKDGNPEPVMSIWTPAALQRLQENAAKGKSGPCFTAKQLWREIEPERGLCEGHGLVRPTNPEWVVDTDTPEEWEAMFGSPPTSVPQ